MIEENVANGNLLLQMGMLKACHCRCKVVLHKKAGI
jgi:hypothetical protein